MQNKANHWYAVVNPSAGSGKTIKLWEAIKTALEASGLILEYAFSEYAGHEAILSREAILRGHAQIIAVGGDGTIQKVVRGVYMQNKVPVKKILIGVIPSGTGNDWIKSHGIPLDYKKAIKIILKKNIKTQDVGKIEVFGKTKREYHFINYAGAGFDCFVLSRLDRYKKFGPLSYFICAIINFMKFKNLPVSIELDALKVRANVFLLGVGLCSFTGGGMRLTKDADPFDGCFDITIAQDFTKLDIVKNIPRLFNGGLFKDKKVFTHRSKTVRVGSKERPVVSQIDGEVLEKGVLVYTLIPEGFTFCSP